MLDSVVSRGELSSTKLYKAIADTGACFTSPIPATQAANQEQMRIFTYRNVDVNFSLPDGRVLEYKAMPAQQENIDYATKQAIDNYGKGYYIPRVKVFEGREEGIKAMIHVMDSKASMEKYVIQHPI